MTVLKTIAVLLLTLTMTEVRAQGEFPSKEGDRARYSALIEMPKAYLSGVCILLREDGVVKGSLFNEFGISALDFTYRLDKEKVKLHHVIKMLDRWYIKRVLKKDMRELIHRLQQGQSEYQNERYHIQYRFTPLKENPTADETEK